MVLGNTRGFIVVSWWFDGGFTHETRLKPAKTLLQVTLTTQVSKNVVLNSPLIAAPMDTVTEDGWLNVGRWVGC